MDKDIGEIVSQCLNNDLINHYFMKKKDMTYDEQDTQENNFSRMIGYCILFKETDGIEDYLKLTNKEQQIQFLKMRIADKLGISYDEIDSRIEEIIDYAFENFIKKGYVFHAGNSSAIEKNMRYGLSPSDPSNERQMELMHIASIYSKYGDDNPLGWGVLDIKYGKNGWFYDGTPENSLYYADSPEWFGQFCGGNNSYAWGVVPEENRHGYANRDYDACLFAVKALIKKNNMSASDEKEILDFFNRCWTKFGDTEPCLAFVPISSLKDSDRVERMRKFYFPSSDDRYYSSALDYIFDDIIKGGCSLMGDNVCCDEIVSSDDLSFVNLSPILPRFKVSESAKIRETTLQDCIDKLNGLDTETLLKVQEMLNQFPTNSNERGL